MDKYEFKLRSEEIDKLMDKQKYADAVRLADTIDWRRVKSASTLAKIAELYKLNKRFEECRDILEMAYDRNPGNRKVVSGLCEISLEFGDIVEAIEYFKEYARLAPNDLEIYVLRYRIYEAQGVGFEERIELLEELKKKDRIEEWEYELAYLYHRAGFATKCVEECDELILWFGDGPYVTKAMELKMLHEPLTPSQQEKYDRRNDEKIQVAAQAAMEKGSDDLDDDFRVKTIDMSKFNTMNLQAELAENVREFINDEPKPVNSNRESQQVYHNTIPADAQEVFFADQTADMRYQVSAPEVNSEVSPEMEAFRDSFSQEYVGQEPPQSMGQLTEDAYDAGTMEMPMAELEAHMQEENAAPVRRDVQEIHFEDVAEEKEEASEPENVIANMQESWNKAMNSSSYDTLLSQEKDGQISLAAVSQPAGTVEKQITGQLNIEDILADWEKMKKEREQKMQEDVRQKVLQQTGQLFTEFDVSSKTGILASLDDPSLFDKMNGEASKTVMKGLENHAKQVIVPGAVTEEVPAETIVSQFTGEISTASAEEEVIPEATIVEEAIEIPSTEENLPITEGMETIIETEEMVETEEPVLSEVDVEKITAVNQEMKVQEVIADESNVNVDAEDVQEGVVEEELVPDFAKAGEGNFYGSVTAAIPGGIWKEVESGLQGTEAYTEEEIIEEKTQEPNDVISGEEEEMDQHKDLTQEERELFGSFLYSRKMKKQILDTLDKITLAAYAGNVVITADSSENALQLAKLVVSYVRSCDDNFSGNVAKIEAEKLNKKDLSVVFSKLENGALLVEKAGELTGQTMKSLLQELNQETTGIIVILMDKHHAMDKLMSRAAIIGEFFNARIDILSMSADNLVSYGIQYANGKGYSVEEMAKLALYKRISDMQAGNHTVTTGEVKDLMKDAMKKAERGGLGKMTSIIMRNRYDENDLIILKEKHFQ